MREDVEHYDLRLIACRPVNLRDMSPVRQKLWDKVTAEVGLPLQMYPGSIHRPCEVCTIPIAIGPRQQEQMHAWRQAGIGYQTLCFICAVEETAVLTNDDEPAVVRTVNLGNPYVGGTDV